MGFGISVSPSLIQLDLAQTKPEFFLQYTNSSTEPVTIKISSKDFTSLEEGWRVNFLEQTDTQNFHYSLSSWLKFSPDNFLLLPQKTQDVKVDIRSNDLIPGTHYSSIIAELSSPDTVSNSAITIKGQLISLAFVRTHTGSERQEAKINSFSAISPNIFSFPEKYLLRLDNSGNTEVVPRGIIVVRNYKNQEISRGILNEQSLITLPESIRRYEIPISTKQPVYNLPGLYQATITVTYGSTNSASLVSHFQFFTFASKLNFILLIVLFFLLFRLTLKFLQLLHGRLQNVKKSN